MIHVNKLKEGWDVSNLFTIVPLRASASDILTEQTLGRGLRLPYGKRTGVDAVDTLTVIAHDRFNDLIEKAKDADGVIHSLKQVKIGEGGDVSTVKPVMVEAPSVIEQMLKSPRARAGLAAFVEDWLSLYRLDTMNRDTEEFPEFSPALPSLCVALCDSPISASLRRRARVLVEL